MMEYLMKKLLLLLISVTTGYAQQFNGTAIDLETGKIQIISGSFDSHGINNQTSKECSNNGGVYGRQINSRADQIFSEMAAQRAQMELEEQTRLLRKIANE